MIRPRTDGTRPVHLLHPQGGAWCRTTEPGISYAVDPRRENVCRDCHRARIITTFITDC